MARRAIAGYAIPKRRRRFSEAPRERTSLSLRADVVDAAKQVVQAGEAENLSAFVEAALEEKLLRSKRAALYSAYDEALTDPLFTADMNAITKSFTPADSDGLE
jgi:hypothetical protein